MTSRGARILWGLLALGVAVRVVLAFATVGDVYDIGSEQLVANALRGGDPLSVYATVNVSALRWPYPAGYFPWLVLARSVAFHTSLGFNEIVRLAPIAADAGLAWVVQAYLGDRGAPEWIRLASAALVALGPSFVLVSGWGGQLDAVAILPAAVAFLVWQRRPPGRRALVAGLLIGAGAAIKTVPIVLLLPLLPTVANRREAIVLVASAIALPIVTIAPWLLAEPHATLRALRYNGIPGYGGLTLLAQPGLATGLLLKGHDAGLSGLQRLLEDARTFITAGALVATLVVLLRRRPAPATGAVMVWLAVFVFGLNFGPRYVTWALPFMLMAGYLWEAVLLQPVAFAAGLIIISRPYDDQWIATVYIVIMLSLLATFAVWLVLLAARTRSRFPPGTA